jgi:exopolysaccharide biosynthesis polyprenyl glycosylphosphotransferase
MLKQRNEQVQAAARGLDIAVCVIAFLAAYHLRSSDLPHFSSIGGIEPIETLTWLLGASIVAHLVIYPLVGFYESLRLKSISDIIQMVLRAGVIEFFVMGAMVFLVQAKTTSRYFFGLFLVINYSLILGEKLGVRFILSAARRRGYNYRQLLIVGAGGNAARLIQSLKRNVHWGFIPSGVLSPSSEGVPLVDLHGVPVLGPLSDLESLIRGRPVDEVIFAMDRIDPEELAAPMQLCSRLGIPTRISLGLFDLPNRKITFSRVEEIPLLTFYTTLRTPFEEFLKRTIDISVSVVGLLITFLLAPWIYLRIQRESPGPILFKQQRVGENGRLFRCYKFRTMALDAEFRKQALQSKNQMEGPLFKIEDDPRVFPFGGFMRRTSIDELPQFFNILRGDMSVVGTRPPTPDEVKVYETRYRKRLSVRPGLTGLWQVSGRNQIRNFEDVLKLDIEYIERWSIGLDLQIIFKTIWVTLFRKGAY